MTEAIVTEPEQIPIAAAKFRPRTPIPEDAQEDRVLGPDQMASATPRPSVDIDKPIQSSTPSIQKPTDIKTANSPTPSTDAKPKTGTDESASSSQPPKIDEQKATGSGSQPQKSDEPKATETAPQPAIKTYTTEKGKSKVTGKTITGWI